MYIFLNYFHHCKISVLSSYDCKMHVYFQNVQFIIGTNYFYADNLSLASTVSYVPLCTVNGYRSQIHTIFVFMVH